MSDCFGVAANLQLSMGVHPQGEEMQEIVEVDFPVGLGVGGQRQILPSLLSGNAGFESFLVHPSCKALQFHLQLRVPVANRLWQELAGSLAV